MGGNNKFIDKFSNVAMRVGGQIHLKALRDTFWCGIKKVDILFSRIS